MGFGLAIPEEVESETIGTVGVQVAGTIDGVGLQRSMMVVELPMEISGDPLNCKADVDAVGRIFELEEVDCETGVKAQVDATMLLAGWAVAMSEESAFSISTSTRGGVTAQEQRQIQYEIGPFCHFIVDDRGEL
jgi:hypothetical protein